MSYYSSFLALLFLLTIADVGSAQTSNFEDGFDDGNFTHHPAWSGDDTLFTITAAEENKLLQLAGNEQETPAYLSTPSIKITGYWEFYIQFDGFEPSGSNRAEIFLMSDRADLKDQVNGYAVQVGESGDDFFKIVRYDDGEYETILSDTATIINDESGYRVKVSRSMSGEWQIAVGEGYDGKLLNAGKTVIDNTYNSSSYFGVLINYTSSRADKFFFDFKIDIPPFAITEIISSEQNSLTIAFNRAYEPATVSAADFDLVNHTTKPSSITFTAADTVQLHFSEALPSAKYELSVSGISDLSGTLLQTSSQEFIVFGEFAQGEVKINEFMYDPPTGLEEYIEIINRSSKYLNLSGWKVADDSNINTLKSSSTVLLEPNSFLVISPDTAALHAIFGNRAYVQTNLPAFNNSGDAVRLLTGSGETADSLFYTSEWGGENVALERRSSSTPATFRENWADSPHPKGGTPGTPNQVPKDNQPPQLTNLNIISSRGLQLHFNERLQKSSATKLTHYKISDSNLHSIQLINSNSVKISLLTPLQNAQKYSVVISGVKDIFGNVSDTDTSFTYHEVSIVDSDDIFINEFSYNPVPGLTEYVEIYNPTSKSFNLQNWTLSDNREKRSIITESAFVIPPNSFAVIAPDNTLLNKFPDILLISMPDFPSLNNSGDDIILCDSTGILLDSLQYTADWGGTEKVLERRTTKLAADFKENWKETLNGTPGFANKIEPDKNPPIFTELFAIDSSTLQLNFSESITRSSATDISNYQITPNRDIQLVSAKKNTVTLFLSDDLKSGKIYTISVSNIADIFGNMLAESIRKVEFLKIEKAKRGNIVINEFLSSPSGGSAEFIEIYNTTDKNFDLSNWYIGDASSKISIGQNIQLHAHSYLVFTESSTFAEALNNAIAFSDFSALNNNGDVIYLQNPSGVTIDSLHYSSEWPGLAGRSLERKDPLAASNDASNWQVNSSGHSAGGKNLHFFPDEHPPKTIFSKVLPNGNIEIRFNEFIQLTNEVQFWANKQELSVIAFDPSNANAVILEASPAKTKAAATHITVRNLMDVKGNRTAESKVAIAQPLRPSDLVINEIMYNPLNDSDDNRADQAEYIELRNTKNYAISLEGMVLHDAPDEDGNIRRLVPVSTMAKWVPPKGIVLVYADQISGFERSKIAGYFDLNPPEKQSIIRIDRSSLSLASSGDAIFISDSTGTTIDSVFYGESWQNPNLIDYSGIALERISPVGPSNDKSNWGSSVNRKGGTPNTENSIYQANAKPANKVGISFSPNPFSPDGDGYEDNIFINYKLDHPDYLLKVHIYDRYGRFITELADGKQAGFEGALIWDGRKNDGSRNRIGIYIVVFEAYNSSTGENKAFKKVIVLARRLD